MNRRQMLRDREQGIRVEYHHPYWTWAATAPNGERSGDVFFRTAGGARRAAKKWLRSVRKGWA